MDDTAGRVSERLKSARVEEMRARFALFSASHDYADTARFGSELAARAVAWSKAARELARVEGEERKGGQR